MDEDVGKRTRNKITEKEISTLDLIPTQNDHTGVIKYKNVKLVYKTLYKS